MSASTSLLSNDRPRRGAFSRRALLVALAAGTASAGCINFGAIMSKMILGDPQIDCSFRQRTDVRLTSKHQLIIFATAPVTVMDESPSLTNDVVEQLSRRFGLRKINVIDPNDVARVIDKKGGEADPRMLAREFPETDYIIHIKLSGYGIKEPNSPNLYRGYAAGLLYAWRATGGEKDKDNAAAPRGVSQIFEQEFQVEHPKHPVSRDSMSLNAFEKQFVDKLSEEVGHVFYDYKTSEFL